MRNRSPIEGHATGVDAAWVRYHRIHGKSPLARVVGASMRFRETDPRIMSSREALSLSLYIVLLALCATACTGPLGPGRTLGAHYPPFYTSASDDKGDSYGYSVLFNIIKHDRSPDRVYSHAVPFYFHWEEKEGDLFTLIPPFYYRKRGQFEEDRFFLLWGSKRRGNRRDIYPLFPFVRCTSYNQSPKRWGFSFFPLLDLDRDCERFNLKLLDFLGLFHLLDITWGVPTPGDEKTGKAFTLLNFLNLLRLAGGQNLGGYDDFQILTLFSSEKLSLFQRHWKKDRGDKGQTVLFPFYWHSKDEKGETLHLWPFWGFERTTEGVRRKHILYPFFSIEKDTLNHGWAFECPWPLVRMMRGKEGDYENRFLPFFMDSRKGDRSILAVPPFYASYKEDGGYHRSFYTPLLSTYEDPSHEEWGIDFLFPFLSHQRSRDRSHDRFLPLYYLTFEKKSHIVGLTPLIWSVKNEEGYAFDLFFPLYSHFGLGEEDHTYSLLPLVKLLMDRPSMKKPGRFQMDLLWPLAVYREQPARREAWIFPLFSHDSGPSWIQWGFIADIIGFKIQRSKKTLTFFWFIPISWGEDDETPSKESQS